MRSSRSMWRVVGFVAAGAVLGTLAGRLLAGEIPVLAHETGVTWHPQANLGVLSFNLSLMLRVNWMTLVGVIAGFFLARRG